MKSSQVVVPLPRAHPAPNGAAGCLRGIGLPQVQHVEPWRKKTRCWPAAHERNGPAQRDVAAADSPSNPNLHTGRNRRNYGERLGGESVIEGSTFPDSQD